MGVKLAIEKIVEFYNNQGIKVYVVTDVEELYFGI